MWRLQQRLSRSARGLLRPQRSAAPRLDVQGASGSSRLLSAAAPSVSTASRRILCVDVPEQVAEGSCVQELVQRGHTVDQVRSASDEYLTSIVADYDAMVVAPGTKLPHSVLQVGARNKLQLVAVPTASIPSEDIDLMEATNQGVMLLQLDAKQVGDRSSVEAELGLSLLIQLARHLPQSMASVRSGEPLNREDFTGVELANKILGVVGIGQAGRRVVDMAQALGLQVYGFDPNLTQEGAALMGVKSVSLDELYSSCDFLTFHAPLTARTRGMFGADALAKCKPGVKIVSVAEYKGSHGLLDEKTLLQGLESGQISGVALDVLQPAEGSEELSPVWQELMQHDKVLTLTHVDGSASGEVLLSRRYRLLAENVGDALAKRYFRGVANAVFMPLTLLSEMQPFLELSEALGRFVHQLTVSADPKDRITKVSLAATGGFQIDITTPQARQALQNALLKGLLQSMRERQTLLHGDKPEDKRPAVGLLNASLLAMGSGLDVRQGDLKHDPAAVRRHLKNCLAVEVETKNKDRLLVKGSVFGDDPRVVRVNEYSDFPAFRPSGNLLVFNNEDVPGAIAGILKELGDAKINIANFGLARQAHVELPLGILTLDSAPSEETLETLKQLPSVRSVRFAQV